MSMFWKPFLLGVFSVYASVYFYAYFTGYESMSEKLEKCQKLHKMYLCEIVALPIKEIK